MFLPNNANNNPETEEKSATSLVQEGVISTPIQNLSSKIDSILKSIENLTQKKMRLEFEIKKQKKSLIKKRGELKRVNSSQSKKLKIALESSSPIEISQRKELQDFQRTVSRLLTESDRVLDD